MSKLNVAGIIDDMLDYKRHSAEWPEGKKTETRTSVAQKLIEFEKVLHIARSDENGLDSVEELERILDEEPTNHLVRWLEEGAMDIIDFHRYAHYWVVATYNTEMPGVYLRRIYATEDQIKGYLLEQIEIDKKGCDIRFLDGTEKIEDIEGENEDTRFTAYATFDDSNRYTIHYVAQMEKVLEIEDVSEGAIGDKR